MNAIVTNHLSSSAQALATTQDVLDAMASLLRQGSKAPCMALEAALYHLETGGQRIRAKIALDACNRLGVDRSTALALASCCELLHNASLVHDDLHDRDTVRRNAPTVWVSYGDEVAVCVGDLMLSAAYCALASVTTTQYLPLMVRTVHQRISQAIRGQCVDLVAHTPTHSKEKEKEKEKTKDKGTLAEINPFNLSLRDYESVAINKSGALLSLPLELSLIAAGLEISCFEAQQAAHAFAIGYQINDDLADIATDSQRAHLAPAVNITSVLQNSAFLESPHDQALGLGVQQLLQAQALCARLPMQCGDYLSQLAGTLLSQSGPESKT